MKKILLMAFGLVMAGNAFAQVSVLKAAKSELSKEVPNHANVASMLKEAMANPETANNVETWYLAGKNGFQTWQTGWEQLQIGGNPDKTAMSNAIVDAFDYYVKAFGMDTIKTEDKKGNIKIKTKFSKDMAKAIASNHNNFYDAGVYLYDAHDLPKAYRAWEIFTLIPNMESLGKDAPAAIADTTLAQTYYNMGIFAYQSEMKPEALKSFLAAAEYGQGEVAYDNALAMASELKDLKAMEKIANEAFSKYNKQTYIGSLINVYVQNKDFDSARKTVDTALAKNPDNAVLYNVKGVLVESMGQGEDVTPEKTDAANKEAITYYKKAVELDAQNPDARFNYGRMLANQAYKTSDDNMELNNADYEKLQNETIIPLFKAAAEQLEACIAINPEANRQAYTILKNIYYNLKDDTNMQRISDLELQ